MDWTYTHATGKTYHVVLRTPLAVVAYRVIDTKHVRIHIRKDSTEVSLPDDLPSPFTHNGSYASCGVANEDARAVIHRAVDWLLQKTGHALVTTA